MNEEKNTRKIVTGFLIDLKVAYIWQCIRKKNAYLSVVWEVMESTSISLELYLVWLCTHGSWLIL